MKRIVFIALFTICLTALGCSEAKSTMPNPHFTEEEKQKINAEDKMIDDEESQGTAAKTKAKSKAKR